MSGVLVANEICPRWGCQSDTFKILLWVDWMHLNVQCAACGTMFFYNAD